MAHKTEKEDTEFDIVAETSTTTAAATLCEKRSATVPVTSSASSKAGKEDNVFRSGPSTKQRTFRRVSGVDPEKSNCGSTPTVKRAVNRCLTCSRRVGLTGFRCRCGELFCAVHRYSDRHDCGFDYKSAAREAIARENPVVKASKIIKI